MYKTIIIILLACNQRPVLAKESVQNESKKNSVANYKATNGNDSSIFGGKVTEIQSVGESSQEDIAKWGSTEFLPLSNEDFPVALHSPSISKSHESLATQSSSSSLPSESFSSSPITTSYSSSVSSSSEAEDILRRMGWTGGDQTHDQMNRFSSEAKPWSKALPAAQSSSSSTQSNSPVNNGNGHHQEVVRPDSQGNSNGQEKSGNQQNNPIEYTVDDLSSSATSNNYDMPANPSTSGQYGSSSSNSGYSNSGRTRYGFRVNAGRNRDADYSGSSNYDDFTSPEYASSPAAESTFNEPYDTSSGTGTQDDYRPDMKQQNPAHSSVVASSPHSATEYDRDARPLRYQSYPLRPRFRPRNQYMTSSSAWPEYADWETASADRGWLSSLFGGYNKYRPRYRSPYGLSAAESLPLSSLPMSFYDTDALNFMRPTMPHPARAATGWGFSAFAPRPQSATSMRPAYSTFPYPYAPRAPPMAGPPQTPYYPAPAAAYYPASSSVMPMMNIRPFSFSSSLNGMLPTMSNYATSSSAPYPVKMPYSPYPFVGRPIYPMLRPFMTDLAFAESFKKVNTSTGGDKMEGSASASQMSYVPPPVLSFAGKEPSTVGMPHQPDFSHIPPPQSPLINRQGANHNMFNFFNPNQWVSAPTKPSNEGETSTVSNDTRSKSTNMVGKIFGRWLT
ncbi:uncharacterized protein LOC141849118 [Brevipalpus obovatus]|uniref:uncharacterized protein LOC141849118 n=1 Tax=Brevipalpus obovatus TaxID=246614 RepID=UPI003D9F584B